MADNIQARAAGAELDSSAATVEEDVTPRRAWRDAGPWPYVLLVVLWFLELYSPHKLITHYVPAARPLSWLPELGLWVCALQWIQWLRWPAPKRGFPAYTLYMLLLIFGVGVAYVLGNWGASRGLVREFYQGYLLALITLTFCTTADRARPILGLYFGYFLWFAIWGVISLKTSPLGPDVDPGARVIVFWHTSYDNRDAFGPLMVAGLAYSIYYLQATRGIRTRVMTAWVTLSIALCALGFITSFGRGTFVGFLAVATSMWLRSRRKIAILVSLVIAIGALSLLAPGVMSRYVQTMQSITGEGTHTGTGADRADLWGLAWREFLSSPIVGVGPVNFGVGAQRVLSADDVTAGGYTRGRLWGRAVHSAPMEILAENGLLGVLVAVLLIVDFFRTNRRIRMHAAETPGAGATEAQGFPPGYLAPIAFGLRAVFLTYLVSSIFYQLLYTQLIWEVIALNRMLYFASGANLRYETSPAAG